MNNINLSLILKVILSYSINIFNFFINKYNDCYKILIAFFKFNYFDIISLNK